ncbi:hypothetical protein [Microbacterium sp.]|uniref:hypothetical protein n=1 Tax=Microbacterium sp. TaxID=51671 RepID=UPI003A8E2CD9
MTILRTKTSRVRMLAVLAVTGAMLSACSPSPAPSPTPTAAFASEDEAFAAAEEVYRAYNDAYNRVDFSDPSSFDPLDSFTTGTYQSSEREGLSELHATGAARSGQASVVWVHGIDMDISTVTVRVCKDLSDVEILDAGGKSLVSPDRPDFSAVELTLEIAGSELLLAGSQAVEDEACVP